MSQIIATTLSNGTVSVPTATVVNGSAKAWVNFNGTGTIAARDSFNVASLTDNGAGDYTVNFTTALADADYAVAHGRSDSTDSRTTTSHILDGQTATTVRLISRVSFSNIYEVKEDAANLYVVIFR